MRTPLEWTVMMEEDKIRERGEIIASHRRFPVFYRKEALKD